MMRRVRRGNAAVEFALTLPLLLAIVSAILDYGWYLTQSGNVMQAVREGARLGATIDQEDGPDSEAIDHATASLRALGVPCDTATACNVEATILTVGGLDAITVTAEISYEPLMGIVPTPALLQGSMTMALEDQSS